MLSLIQSLMPGLFITTPAYTEPSPHTATGRPPDRHRRQNERLPLPCQKQRGAHHMGNRLGRRRRYRVADELSLGLAGKPIQLQRLA